MSHDQKAIVETERALCLNGANPVRPSDADAEKSYPLLFDLLSPRFKDGKQTRLPASLSIRMVGGCYKVSINCPTEQVCTMVPVTSLDTMWLEIESALTSGGAYWGPDYESQKKARQALRK